MKERSDTDEGALNKADDLDERIHKSLIEMGLIFPRTAEDVRIAEESSKGVQCRPLPVDLADPSRLLRRIEELDAASNDTPLKGILAAAKERSISNKQLAALTKLSVVLISMFDRGMISTVKLPRIIVRRIAEAIGTTAERVLEYLQAGPRLAIDTNFKADDVPELEEPQNFFDAVRDDPTLTPQQREYLLSLEAHDQ
jgi:hypothetical protein